MYSGGYNSNYGRLRVNYGKLRANYGALRVKNGKLRVNYGYVLRFPVLVAVENKYEKLY